MTTKSKEARLDWMAAGVRLERKAIITMLKIFDPLEVKTTAWESGDSARVAIAIRDKIIRLIEKRGK